jgi:ABC-type dipeptide/oligopeptide/nickel transport system ATPase component
LTVNTILEVSKLKTWFYTRRGIVKAVNGVDFDLGQGECLCLVGESGCEIGYCPSLLRFFDSPPGKIVSGEVIYDGIDLVNCPVERIRQVRGKEIAMVFQNAQSALNPVFTIGDQIMEQINAHGRHSRADVRKKARLLLEEMNIPQAENALNMYPHQMSGGMKQKAMIAMSLSCDPSILIADEPLPHWIRYAHRLCTTAGTETRRNMSIIFITRPVAGARDRPTGSRCGQQGC